MVEEVIRKLLEEHVEGLEVVTQPVVGITCPKGPIADLYPETKVALFYGELNQTVSLVPQLKPLLDYLDKEGYEYNIS